SCPGIHFANAETFLFVTRVLALFKVMPIVDANGVERVPPLSYKATFTSQPMPFACQFCVRDPRLVELFWVRNGAVYNTFIGAITTARKFILSMGPKCVPEVVQRKDKTLV
ncbi:hypothetical protein BJ138DRAFT_1106729, partial [Hygrophoropsis aurantiaca]